MTITVSIDLEDGSLDVAEVTFSGYAAMASPGEVMDDMANRFGLELRRMLGRRYISGVSGAMRWPWSQEDPITHGKDIYL